MMNVTVTVRGSCGVGKTFLLATIKSFLRLNYEVSEVKRKVGKDLDGIPNEQVTWKLRRFRS